MLVFPSYFTLLWMWFGCVLSKLMNGIGAATRTQGRKWRNSDLKTEALIGAACQEVSAFGLYALLWFGDSGLSDLLMSAGSKGMKNTFIKAQLKLKLNSHNAGRWESIWTEWKIPWHVTCSLTRMSAVFLCCRIAGDNMKPLTLNLSLVRCASPLVDRFGGAERGWRLTREFLQAGWEVSVASRWWIEEQLGLRALVTLRRSQAEKSSLASVSPSSPVPPSTAQGNEGPSLLTGVWGLESVGQALCGAPERCAPQLRARPHVTPTGPPPNRKLCFVLFSSAINTTKYY